MAFDNLPDVRPIVTLADARTLGLTRYFTGETCPHGHVAERHTSSRGCTACNKGRYKQWIADNPDKLTEYKRADHAKHRDARRVTQKAWEVKNLPLLLERNKRWAALNPEKVRMCASVNNARRRARLLESGGTVTKAEITAILTRQKYRCAWCNTSIKKKWHMDHVLPLTKGGAHSADNLVGSCPSCNHRKHSKDPIDWARSLGRLL